MNSRADEPTVTVRSARADEVHEIGTLTLDAYTADGSAATDSLVTGKSSLVTAGKDSPATGESSPAAAGKDSLATGKSSPATEGEGSATAGEHAESSDE